MTDMKKVNLNASAVLVWMPLGQEPGENFDPYLSVGDDHPNNPSSWWRLQPAVICAVTDQKDHVGRAPWIKSGTEIFSPEDIQGIYELLPTD